MQDYKQSACSSPLRKFSAMEGVKRGATAQKWDTGVLYNLCVRCLCPRNFDLPYSSSPSLSHFSPVCCHQEDRSYPFIMIHLQQPKLVAKESLDLKIALWKHM